MEGRTLNIEKYNVTATRATDTEDRMRSRAGASSPVGRSRRRAASELDSDTALISSILRGDPYADEMFVTRYERLISTILRRMGLPIQEREDLFQQVFLHLWDRNCRRLSQWQARGKGKFSSFLEVVVVRLVYDYQRRAHERVCAVNYPDLPGESGEHADCTQLVAVTPDLDHLLVCRLQRAAIDSVLLRLSPRDAQIIRRRHYHEQSYREISDALDIRIEQVGVVLLRAERRLRKQLAAAYPGLSD